MSQKSFLAPYEVLTELLVAERRAAAVTQEELADRLSIAQSTVSKIERGVQRLDLVELHRWLLAIGGRSFTDFAIAFDESVGTQAAAEIRWVRPRKSATSSAMRPRTPRKA